MFEYIIGDIVSLGADYIVMQNNNIGYKIFTSSNTISNLDLEKKDQVLYTQLQVREDGLFLFGFSTEEEMYMYKLLLLVSKIGPKIAIGILSTLSPNQIKLAIIKKDIDTLCKGPGVGKKTAERIILELKDRIDHNVTPEDDIINLTDNDYDEAVQALMSLGYTKFEVEKVVRKLDISGMDLEVIIREGLKKLSKH